MALPPLARWESEYLPAPGSAEAELASFLVPRDWAGEAAVPAPAGGLTGVRSGPISSGRIAPR